MNKEKLGVKGDLKTHDYFTIFFQHAPVTLPKTFAYKTSSWGIKHDQA